MPGVAPLTSVAVRLKAAERGLAELVPQYEAALRAKTLPPEIAHAVDRIATDQRPVLDYMAHRLIEIAGGARTRDSQYPLCDSPAGFATQHPRRLPEVGARRPDLLGAVEARQPYQPGYDWLRRLNQLANDSKHVDLVPQARTEQRRSEVRSAGGSVSWGPGVTFGNGVTVGGAPIDPRTQRPAFLPPGTTYTETTYVDWLLPDGHSAVGSLQTFQIELDRLVRELAGVAGLTWPA